MRNVVLGFIFATITVVNGISEICIGVPDLSYVRSQNACYLYYSCIDGMAYPQSCSEGLYFSMELQHCVPPAESDCDLEEAPELPQPPLPEQSPMCDGVENFRYLDAPERCDRYYQCIDGIAYHLSCPLYFIFSVESQRCGNQYEFTCEQT
ncbi:probable endochitinase [Wyeomyia smithii]|uniref:probable endochitinase n=1 Tax=Wyeomyia smithii TaxID=174621 RepID=UPI0024682096|nr:probable endochitinase [Wyeomyia smithii]